MQNSAAAAQRSGRAPLPFVLGAVLVLGISACSESTLLEVPQGTRQASVAGVPSLPDRYIIQFDRSVADPAALAEQLAGGAGGRVHFTYTDVLRGFAATIPAAGLEGIRRNPHVQLVELDQVVVADDVQGGATWGLDRVDQRALPLSGSYLYDYTGQGVTAYIFDTGIRYDHAEFGGRARAGYDAIGDGRNGADCNGHGTHVAGTVGGQTYGVAKGVQLVSMRVLGCDGYGSYSGMIAAMDWVVRNRTGPAVANFSLGGSVSSSLNTALSNMIAAGVATSVSAGNDGGDACLKSPASTPTAVTVAATTSSDGRASYSNYGSCVDVFAPGSSITSASYGSTTGTAVMSGTSMASPHAAGVLALLQQQQAGLTSQQLRDWLVSLATQNIVSSALSANAHLLYSVGTGTTAPGGTTTPTDPTPVAAPAAPANLTATQGGKSQARLSWSDLSTNESGFRIERRIGSGTWAALASVGAGVASYTDGGLTQGLTYGYRVIAFNAAGSSAASNEAALTITARKNGH